jgi:hypothetical protein
MIKWGNLFEDCLIFIYSFKPITLFDLIKNKINEGLITYSSNTKKQEDRIMKTAQYTKSLTVSLRPEVFDQIKQITDEKHISIGEWVRDAIDTALSTIQQKEATMK